MYSSIEEINRKEVINNCYWPLFRLVEMGFPIGIEVSGITLEIIASITPEWINKLIEYINEGKIEFIGSGYSQIIGPLVPAKVNEWNQNIGLNVYKELLGIKPQIALVNEMAYSAGIVEHYINTGYEAIVMEWNNPHKSHHEWENEWRYFPQKVIGADGRNIPVIWADSIAFQKFQRYVHGEYGLDEYVEYIRSNASEDERYFPLYSNDVEIFDYRPGRYHTEAQIDQKSEWVRIIDLYNHLNQQDWCELVFPSDVLDGLIKSDAGHKLQLESPAQPIPVKKQEKYNMNRWALTGRDDLDINTKCYQIYEGLVSTNNENSDEWKELCYLWSSDFRTHITNKRWEDFIIRLNDFIKQWPSQRENEKKDNPSKNELPLISEEDKWLTIENAKYRIVFNKNKGLTIQNFICKDLSDISLLGTLDHGYFDDIALGADYYSGHAVIERSGDYKVTDLGKVSPEVVEMDNCITLKTEQVWDNYKFRHFIQINSELVIIKKSIECIPSEKAIIHPYNFTFNPEAWDQKSLYIKTHNGGSEMERFYLQNQYISHGEIYSALISARHGFGNTEGTLVVGDNNKTISFNCNMTSAALIPSIIYKEIDDTYFFRLHYSAQEVDETITYNNSSHIYKLIIRITK